jgi:hypothetical protein
LRVKSDHVGKYMRRNQIIKNVGAHVQLEPPARFLDENGVELLPTRNDDWIVHAVDEDGLRIQNIYSDHVTTLGYDHIHHYTSNPDRFHGGVRYGFLTLNVQIFIQGVNLSIRPNARPGQPVDPPKVEIGEKWVDFRYAADSGLQAELQAAGYEIGWCDERKLARRLDLDGYELVLIRDRGGTLVSLHCRSQPSNLTLIKKRRIR